jgi:hypothetical protein
MRGRCWRHRRRNVATAVQVPSHRRISHGRSGRKQGPCLAPFPVNGRRHIGVPRHFAPPSKSTRPTRTGMVAVYRARDSPSHWRSWRVAGACVWERVGSGGVRKRARGRKMNLWNCLHGMVPALGRLGLMDRHFFLIYINWRPGTPSLGSFPSPSSRPDLFLLSFAVPALA